MKKKFTLAGIAAGSAAVTIGLSAPSVAAPSGPGSAQDTINSLQASRLRVILNRLSDVPLDQATVVAIRPGASRHAAGHRQRRRLDRQGALHHRLRRREVITQEREEACRPRSSTHHPAPNCTTPNDEIESFPMLSSNR